MHEKYRSEVKRKALRVIAVCAVILLVLILSRYSGEKGGPTLETAEQRMELLSSMGLDVVKGSEEFASVTFPEELDEVLIKYNQLQLSQGFDLRDYCGRECDCYTYELSEPHSSGKAALVTIYICDGKLIAGDIHSAEANGFMAPLTE